MKTTFQIELQQFESQRICLRWSRSQSPASLTTRLKMIGKSNKKGKTLDIKLNITSEISPWTAENSNILVLISPNEASSSKIKAQKTSPIFKDQNDEKTEKQKSSEINENLSEKQAKK